MILDQTDLSLIVNWIKKGRSTELAASFEISGFKERGACLPALQLVCSWFYVRTDHHLVTV